MSDSALVLTVSPRTVVGKANAKLRAEGFVPGVVYGHKRDTLLVQCEARQLASFYELAGDSSLIDLTVGDAKPIKVLVQSVSYEPVSGRIEHVDFYAVNMAETVQTDVVLRFEGVSPAVKDLAGILVKNKSTLKVKCLPQDLVKEIVVDISSLRTFDDEILVKDIKLPTTLTVLDSPDDIIVTTTPPRSDEELADLNKTVSEDVSKVEGVVKASDTAKTEDPKSDKKPEKK